MTPNIALVHVQTPGWSSPRLWLPLFLLWLPLLLLAPFLLVAVVIACRVQRMNPWRVIAATWRVVCSLSGTDVRVTSEDTHVTVKIL